MTDRNQSPFGGASDLPAHTWKDKDLTSDGTGDAWVAECQADAAEAVDIIGRQIGDIVGGRLSDEWGVDGGVDVAESARKATRGRYLALHATHTLRAETRTQ